MDNQGEDGGDLVVFQSQLQTGSLLLAGGVGGGEGGEGGVGEGGGGGTGPHIVN